jgi:serine O-acetyltransferase
VAAAAQDGAVLAEPHFEVTGADIHPAARIGQGVMLDHGTAGGGETAVIGNNVSILHGVTLGGSGKDRAIATPRLAMA